MYILFTIYFLLYNFYYIFYLNLGISPGIGIAFRGSLDGIKALAAKAFILFRLSRTVVRISGEVPNIRCK